MRASRLLSILMLLQARGRMSAHAMAREFGVSVRTIYRDVDELSASGVPVYADKGRAGGFQLLDGYRTQLTGMTVEEAGSLFLAGLPGPAAQLGKSEVLQAAQLKLLAALPRQMQADAHGSGARFHLDAVGWFKGAEQLELLPAIADAVWGDRRIAVRYKSWNDTVERNLEPLGLVLKSGAWYLVAQVGKGARTYRVGSILQLTVSEQTFKRPAKFELAQFWSESSRRFEQSLFRGEAVLNVTDKGLRWLSSLGALVVAAAEKTAAPASRPGWQRVTIPIETIEHATGELLKLGVEAEVLEPPELRVRMGELIAQIAALYS